uniref:Uncharacterized protein n=1 Tax=Rhodnius prolixus TaxID=13249 RepID=T1HH73_RHOPR
MDDEKNSETLNKFVVFGFDKEITLPRDDPREKQRKLWKIKMRYLRSSGEKMLPQLYDTDRALSMTVEAEEAGQRKPQRKGYYTEKFLPDSSFDRLKVLDVLELVVPEFAETLITSFDPALSKVGTLGREQDIII